MPAVLICPCCGAPYNQDALQCQYCRVNFSTRSGEAPEGAPGSGTAEIPVDWIRYTDPWNGFSVLHPSGWKVWSRAGAVGIREDPLGISAAGVLNQRLTSPKSAREFLQSYLSFARLVIANLAVWEAPGTAQAPEHVLARFEGDYLGYHVAGVFDARVQAQQALLSSFGCPMEQIQSKMKCFQSILASFGPSQRMERQKHMEATEGAYAIWTPPGWQVNARINRQNINNAASLQVVVQRDTQGLVQTSLPDVKWNFEMGMPPWGSNNPVMPYLPATQFFQNFILPQISQQCQDLQVIEIVDRPDQAMAQMREMQKIGMTPNSQMVTSAHMLISYMEAGVRLRQHARVDCIGSPGVFGGMWSAYLSNVYRAPENEFDELESILIGILDSLTYNPSWKQAEDARNQGYLVASFQDRMRRLGQISQTIHETNEMVSQGYQHRQESDDRLRHAWSNATLGVQDMADSSGVVYSVPSGYDQYWRDGLDNLYVGDWLANPDPTWTRLEPA